MSRQKHPGQVAPTKLELPPPTQQEKEPPEMGIPVSLVESRPPLAPLWRWGNPSLFALLLLGLPLPFVEIGCNNETVVYQTGAQTIYGGHSVTRKFSKVAEQKGADQPQHQKQPAYLMLAIFLCIIFGLFVAVCAPLDLPRACILSVSAGAAAGLLIFQLFVGFPIEWQIAEAVAQQAASANNPGMAMAAMFTIQVHYTIWFYLWVVLVFLTLIAAVAETVAVCLLNSHPLPETDSLPSASGRAASR